MDSNYLYTPAVPRTTADYLYPVPGAPNNYSPDFSLPMGLEHRFPSPILNRLQTPVGSLSSSPTIPSLNSSPRTPGRENRGQFIDFTLDPLLKRRYSDDEDNSKDEVLTYQPASKRLCSYSPDQMGNAPDTNEQKSKGGFSQLDMLSYISMRSSNETPAFLQSDQTYTVFQPLTLPAISHLLEYSYGGRVIVSRKRKPLQTDFESQVTTPQVKKTKQAQGRPYSSEMVIDLIFPKTIDALYEYLCVKGTPPAAHRVKLQTHDALTFDQPVKDKDGTPVFSNSQSMVQYYTGSTQFSIITAFRQSSMDRSAFKKGTCPVVKFNISPVSDYSIEYLKRMAYPRYKACMKIYLVPQVFAEAHTFYTSGAMYLQDQEMRIASGMPIDMKSRIFHSKCWPDLPNSVYDREFRNTETKTKLKYILN